MKTQGATGLYKVHLSYAKWKLSELVERAGQGETIGIARDGKLTAAIRPPSDIDEIFDSMEKIRRRAKPQRGVTTKNLIEEGRM